MRCGKCQGRLLRGGNGLELSDRSRHVTGVCGEGHIQSWHLEFPVEFGDEVSVNECPASCPHHARAIPTD
jgi:hypothetical protein